MSLTSKGLGCGIGREDSGWNLWHVEALEEQMSRGCLAWDLDVANSHRYVDGIVSNLEIINSSTLQLSAFVIRKQVL